MSLVKCFTQLLSYRTAVALCAAHVLNCDPARDHPVIVITLLFFVKELGTVEICMYMLSIFVTDIQI